MSIELKRLFPPLPKTARGQALVINGDPKGETILYTNGLNVIVLNLEKLSASRLYVEHQHNATVAKYSPSRFYIASGDASGKVRIWATDTEEYMQKYEYMVLGGEVSDLAWSGDSSRLVVAGAGRETYVRAIKWDTGTNLGELSGHAKKANSCDFKSERPYRIATASEDFKLCFFEGPPFKFSKYLTQHTNFVNVVRYAPDGTVFVSAGQDGKIFKYDGKTGEFIEEIGSPAHKGGIYALSFSPDSKNVLTASGDKTCKVYDVVNNTLVHDFPMGEMQVSCLWMKSGPNEHLISVALSGFINFLDPENPTQPKRIIQGHQKPITALTITEDGSRFYTSGTDGVICEWDADTGESQMFSGKSQANQVASMKLIGGSIISVSMDDTIMISDAANRSYGERVKLPSQPLCMDASEDGTTVVACFQHIVVVKNGEITSEEPIPENSIKCVAMNPSGSEFAVGSCLTVGDYSNPSTYEVRIHSLSGASQTDKNQFSVNFEVLAMAYSPDGTSLAVGDARKAVTVYSLPTNEVKGTWCLHSAKITSVHWSPNSRYLASGGLDKLILIYDLDFPKKSVLKLKKTQGNGHINQVRWLSDNSMVTAYSDSCIKVWDVNHLQ